MQQRSFNTTKAFDSDVEGVYKFIVLYIEFNNRKKLDILTIEEKHQRPLRCNTDRRDLCQNSSSLNGRPNDISERRGKKLTCMQMGQKVIHEPHLVHMHWCPQSKHTVFVALIRRQCSVGGLRDGRSAVANEKSWLISKSKPRSKTRGHQHDSEARESLRHMLKELPSERDVVCDLAGSAAVASTASR